MDDLLILLAGLAALCAFFGLGAWLGEWLSRRYDAKRQSRIHSRVMSAFL